MKDSGIPWIGDIPKEWELNQTSTIFHEHKDKNVGLKNNNLLSLSYGKIIRKNINTNEGLLPQSFETYNVIKSGDIVFRLTDLQNDKRSFRTGLCLEDGIITSAYVTLRANKTISPSFYHYLYHIYDVCKVFYGMGDGVRQGMNWDDVRKIVIFCPLLEEQQRIAEFLDKKCGEIDEAIALQEEFIEELKAYKQSVITEAVTRGLNPNVKLKDSGIDWIGKIPQGWKLIRLKYLCKIETGNQDTQDAVPDGEYPFYVRSPQVERSNKATFEGEGILMAGDGAGAGRVFHHAYGKYAVHQRVYRLSEIEGVFSKYLFYYISNLFGRVMDMGSAQSTVPSVRLPMLNNFAVCIPSPNEQQQIADYLDNKCTEIDSLIAIKQQKIEELKDYKKSVIYEYVTGKKDVNG